MAIFDLHSSKVAEAKLKWSVYINYKFTCGEIQRGMFYSYPHMYHRLGANHYKTRIPPASMVIDQPISLRSGAFIASQSLRVSRILNFKTWGYCLVVGLHPKFLPSSPCGYGCFFQEASRRFSCSHGSIYSLQLKIFISPGYARNKKFPDIKYFSMYTA